MTVDVKVLESNKKACLRFEASTTNSSGIRVLCTFANVGFDDKETQWTVRVFEPLQNVYDFPTVAFVAKTGSSLEKVAATGWHHLGAVIAGTAEKQKQMADLLNELETEWSNGRVNE